MDVGWEALSANETAISVPDVATSSQGVRQLCPCVVRASAPGGSDSTRSVSVAGDPLKKSRLGIDMEHAASAKPHARMAITRLMVIPTIGAANSRLCPQPEP